MVAARGRGIDGQPLGVDVGRLREDHSRLAVALFGAT
jgi:8-oxoguanine deaminase